MAGGGRALLLFISAPNKLKSHEITVSADEIYHIYEQLRKI